MHSFEPTDYGPATARLLQDVELCQLGPGRPHQDHFADLRPLRADDIVPDAADPTMAQCCVSGLWLRHHFLDESHEISQDIGSSSGSYWHGIMHRREPDYSNAKYWFRRVGDHPIFPQLLVAARDVTQNDRPTAQERALLEGERWDPFAFVDVCQAAGHGSDAEQLVARKIATAEWELLFAYCFHQAQS